MLASWWMPCGAALIAVIAVLPSLGAGWAIDDYVHRSFLLNSTRFPWDLYGFLKGDVESTAAMVHAGQLPWWTLDNIRIAFFRPLASLTQWLDYRLWPESPVLMHAHSVLWFAACVWVAGRLYRRMIGASVVAGMAVLLFALDDAHHLPVTWIANRNVLPAFFFGVVALLAHDRWSRERWRFGLVWSTISLALSLFSAEAGAATVGYLVAHALFMDDRSRRARVMSLLPYVAVVIVWRIVYAQLGYGTWGSGFYTDPATEPGQFLACVALRAPILLGAQFVMPPVSLLDGLAAMFGATWSWSLIAVVVLLPVAVLLAPLLRRRLNRFWLAGMLCALVPVCATIPMTRLLFFVGLGAFPLIAEFLVALWGVVRDGGGVRWRRRFEIGLGGYFIIVHIVTAPIQLALMSRHVLPPSAEAQLFVKTPMTAGDTGRTVLLVNSPSVFHARHSGIMNAIAGQPFPHRMYALAPSWSAVTIHRTAESTLVVRPATGYLVRPLDVLFRGAHHLIPDGTTIALAGLTVEITDRCADGRPAEATFRFERALEDRQWYWFCHVDGAYAPFSIPAVGQKVELPAPELS